MRTYLPLRLALATNAVFSLSCSLLMLFRPALVGEWLEIQAPIVLQVVGLVLSVFAAELIFQATRRRVVTWRALLASIADFSWVTGTLVLLLFFPKLFSPLGNTMVLAVGSAVFLFAAWQLWAIERSHRIGKDQYRHCIIVETNAPAEKMWRVVSDIGDIKNYMPSLKHSAILDGKTPSVGAIRICEDRAGKQWSEECIEFNSGRSFAVRFVSEAPNFPFPAKSMCGGWEVTRSSGGSQVMVWWELTPKIKLLAPIILPLLAFQADRDFLKVVQRMATSALEKNQNGEVQVQSNSGVLARLLPIFC